MKNKMLKILILSICFFIKKTDAQNLVLNPSFEDMLACPDNGGQLYKAIYWINPTQSLPGYFNSCSSNFGTPQNGSGYQMPRTGNAYAGIIGLQYQDFYIAYIQGQFIDTLKKDSIYCLNFWVSLSENSNSAISKMGAYISDTSFQISTTANLTFIPQIESPATQYLNDTTNWILVSGTYIAQGGEKYITIGNFHSISEGNYIYFGNGESAYAGYYIDDVSVFQVKSTDAGADTAICNEDSVQIGTTNYSEFTYSWQPAAGISNPNSGVTKVHPTQTTTYYLTQTTPCSVTIDSITVIACDSSLLPSSLQVPNIFTPNNDGINDEFRFKTKNIATINCKIYNRWGILVGEITAPNEVWDGRTTSGMQVIDGVYFYVLTAKGNNGKEYNERGFVQLMR
jgi:gliding motility-associated-like protein